VDDETNGAFRVPDARRAGASRRSIDSEQLDRPFHGLRALAEEEGDDDVFQRKRTSVLRAVQLWSVHMHTAEYFSHETAAVLLDLPLPPSSFLNAELHVSSPGRAVRAKGVRGHEVKATLAVVVDHPLHGVRVTDAPTTWAMLGARLRHPYDLVAIGDAIVRTPRIPGPRGRVERPPLASLLDLDTARRAGRRVGAKRLRESLELIRPGAASRTETWTRLTLVDGGLPEPALDFDVYDDAGSFVGCVDLAYVAQRIAIEYEGDQHRTDPVQWQRDVDKHERLADLGWRVVRVTRDQLFDEPGVLVARVRRLLRSR
jgi:hypothetical protein